MSKGACECLVKVLVNVFTPPSGNPVSAPVFHLSKFRPPPLHLDGWLRACVCSCIATTKELPFIQYNLRESPIHTTTLSIRSPPQVSSKIGGIPYIPEGGVGPHSPGHNLPDKSCVADTAMQIELA